MSSKCITIYLRYCYFCPLVASHSHLAAGAPARPTTQSKHTHAGSFLDDNMSFIFYILKVYYLQTKSTKKKDQKDFLTNTVCLHIVVRKFTFIFLFPPLQVTNRQFLFLRAVGYVNELNNDHVSGLTEDRAARHHRRLRGSAPPSVSTTNVIGKHMKNCGRHNQIKHLVRPLWALFSVLFASTDILFFYIYV